MRADLSRKTPKDFFISYNSADRLWAEWIGWHLQQAGYSIVLPNFGLRPGYNFALELDNITKEAERIIAVLSPDYIRSLYAQLDWALVIKRDTQSKQGLVLPVQVQECKHILKDVLGEINYVDLVGKDESAVQDILLSSIHRQSFRPHRLEVAHSTPQENKRLRSYLKKASYPLEGETNNKDVSSSLVWKVPYQPDPFFIGRQEILEQLHSTFGVDKDWKVVQPQALCGIGGIGKTQIALEYASRYRYKYQVVLWINANTHQTIVSDFIASANCLNLPEANEADQSLVGTAVKRWLEDHTKWLLILDDVDDLGTVSDFILYGSKGHVLLTTRAHALGTLAQSIEVEKMRPDEGALFVLRRAKIIDKDITLTNAPKADRNKAREITQIMDGLPLALDQAGAYIEENGCNLSDYLDAYIKKSVEFLSQRGRTSFNHPEPISTTWSISFEKVKQANHAAAELLCLCAFLSPDAIPEELIIEGTQHLDPMLQSVAADPIMLDKAIAEILKYSLIRRNAADKTLIIHRLVQTVLKNEMNKKTQELWAKRIIQIVNRSFPDAALGSWNRCQRYFPQALVCAELIDQWEIESAESARLLYEAATYLWQHAQYHQAEPLYLQALRIRQKALGSDYIVVAQTLHSLARLYHAQGKYALAEQYCEDALAIQKKILPTEHLDIAMSLNELASLYHIQGKYTQAEKLYLQALAIREQLLLEQPDVAQTLDNLAALHTDQGRYAEAERLYERIVYIRNKTQGGEHPDMASSLNGLGLLYYIQGKYNLAEQYYQCALEIRQKVFGRDHPYVAQTLNDQARLYRTRGLYSRAEQLYQKALGIRKRALGSEHPLVAQSLNNLARLYRTLGRYTQAEQLHLEDLRIRRNVLGPDHLDVAQSLNNLARLYCIQGKYTLAEEYCRKALELWQNNQETNAAHPYVVIILNNLTEIYRVQGRYTEALHFGNQAREIQEQTLGSEHPRMAHILNNLAAIYYDLGDYHNAETFLNRALAIRRQALGEEHPYIAFSLTILAKIYQVQDRYTEAEALYLRALAIREQTLEPYHPDVATNVNDLAELYHIQGNYTEAEPLYRHALALYEQTLGADHLNIARVLECYANLLGETQRNADMDAFLKRAQMIRNKWCQKKPNSDTFESTMEEGV